MSIVARRLLVLLVALVVATAGVFVTHRASAASSATPVVYVATGENFPDALGAGPAAAMVRGPILLVSQNGIPSATATELSRLSPDKIIIVGGTAVVSPGVENGLKAYASTVERIAGSNRYETAAQLSAATFPVAVSGGGDADTLDGLDSTAFAMSGHNHDAAYLTKTGKAADAELLDGMDSAAFAASGHNHDAAYLATTGKAANADLLDGKDSSTFVEHGDITMAASGSNWQRFGSTSDPNFVVSFGAYTNFGGEGDVELGLDAPTTVDGVSYQLKDVAVCVELAMGAYIDDTIVYGSDGAVHSILEWDTTDRLTTGCYTVAVSAPAPNGAAVRLDILDGDGGANADGNLFGVRATWTPTP